MTEAATQLVKVSGAWKLYGDLIALADIDLAIEPGSVTCLLGPNGAGKSTLIRMILGLVQPDRGSVKRAPMDLGYAGQEVALYPTLSIAQNLMHTAELAGIAQSERCEAVERVVNEFSLGDIDRVVRTCSGGTRRRVHVAAAVIHDPALIVLDEPTAGVDAESRNQILDVVMRRAESGSAVLYSTHYFAEAERLDGYVIMLASGKAVLSGSMTDVVASNVTPYVRVRFEGLVPGLAGLPCTKQAAGQLRVDAPLSRVIDVLARTTRPDFSVKEVRVVAPTIEDVYNEMVREANEYV